jgi:pyridoxine 5-phosphate synthase
LKNIIPVFKNAGIRVSIFVDPVIAMVDAALETGTHRIELYTEGYAKKFHKDKEMAIQPYLKAATRAKKSGWVLMQD